MIALATARKAARSGALWGAVFGLIVIASAAGYATTFPTVASRQLLARSFGSNAGLAALIGQARSLDTVAGFTAWRTLGILTIVGAIWGVLTATRLLRGEEEAGRWELLLAGPTTRGGAAVQAMAGLGVGLAVLWAITAVCTLAAGASPKVRFSVTGSLFLSTALVAAAAVFLAIGALVSQLAGTRRQANAIGGSVIGLAYLVRMAADASAGLRWLRWLSPLGWVEQLRPLTGSQPLVLVPIMLVGITAAMAAAALAGRRDIGASALPSRDDRAARLGLLGGPIQLTIRLTRPVLVSWVIALASTGLVFGLVAQSAASAVTGSPSIEQAIARLGGRHGGASSYLGFAFVFAAALVAFAAAGQISATRNEEANGLVDNLLVRPVRRARWLVGRFAVGATIVVVASVVAGLATWVGAASQHTGVGLGELLKAGLNIAGPAIFVLGVGGLVYGIVPRPAPSLAFAVVIWSFLIQLVTAFTIGNRWLLDTSLFHHIAPAPAAPPNWTTVASLTALGIGAMFIGIVAFSRRDLVSA